jgi:hypothetical protein
MFVIVSSDTLPFRNSLKPCSVTIYQNREIFSCPKIHSENIDVLIILIFHWSKQEVE